MPRILSSPHYFLNVIFYSVQIMGIWDWFSTHFTFYIEDENSGLFKIKAFRGHYNSLLSCHIFLNLSTCCSKYLKNWQVAEYKSLLNWTLKVLQMSVSFLKPVSPSCICVNWNFFINSKSFKFGNTTLEIIRMIGFIYR